MASKERGYCYASRCLDDRYREWYANNRKKAQERKEANHGKQA